MTLVKEPKNAEHPPEDVIFPESDLYSNEPPVETHLHLQQMLLLLKCLDWLWRDRTDYFASGNLTIYYSPRQRKSEDFRDPDFFAVLDTEKKPRKSWVVWEEDGRYPNIIIELLSKSTAAIDRGLKKQLYQDIFRTPDYFWFDPDTLEFAGFHLLDGQYEPITANESGYLWSKQLGLYLGIVNGQLRFFTPAGELVQTPEESAESERQQKQLALAEAETERQQKELALQKAAQLSAKLQELGIDPDSL
jgi:Uma2 family endonuclease